MWSVWTVDENPLLVGFVRKDLLSWVAKTREGVTDIRAGFRSRADASKWILLQGGYAQEPKQAAAELREAA